MKTKFHVSLLLGIVALAGLLAFAGWMYARPTERVSLDVRNMPVREVAKLMERQTGRSIVVQSNVSGKVTLKAKDLPFQKALEIVGEQTFARVASMYPLYSSEKSLNKLKGILSGTSESPVGWTNLAAGPMRFGGPGPRREEAQKEQKISLNISFEDLAFAAMAFSRLTPARVVVEDGATKRISVSLTNSPIREAVAMVAKKAGMDWTEIYTLSGSGPGPGRGPERLAGAPRGNGEISEEQQAEREVLDDQLLATLPLEERQKREEAAAERQKRMLGLQNMTPEQRLQAMQAMRQNQPGGSQRILERIKNSTPEQRAAQRKQMARGPRATPRPAI